jgi:hypothetical protein
MLGIVQALLWQPTGLHELFGSSLLASSLLEPNLALGHRGGGRLRRRSGTSDVEAQKNLAFLDAVSRVDRHLDDPPRRLGAQIRLAICQDFGGRLRDRRRGLESDGHGVNGRRRSRGRRRRGASAAERDGRPAEEKEAPSEAGQGHQATLCVDLCFGKKKRGPPFCQRNTA